MVFNKSKQSGFSIVELMVAILIGLIILAGVIQVVLSSKTTFLGQEDMAFIQENARYAMETISKDIRSAGYWGCAGKNPKTALVAPTTGTNAAKLLGVNPIESITDGSFPTFSGTETLWDPPNASGSHSPETFIVRRAGGETFSISSHINQIVLNSNAKFTSGDYIAVVAEDCRRVGVLQVFGDVDDDTDIAYSACTSAVKPSVLDGGYNCSTPDVTTKPVEVYQQGSVVMDYLAHAYFIQESSVLPGQPALKRLVLKGGATVTEEIALGVEDMAIKYGVRIGNNIRYLTATEINSGTASWANVISVEVSLLMRSQLPSRTGAVSGTEPGIEDNVYTDRYVRRLVSSTVLLKNRI